MNRENIEKIAQTAEDKILLAKLWDKIHAGISREIPAHTGFLSPRELEMSHFLFGQPEGLISFGGYENAERKMLVYMPQYLADDWLYSDQTPVCCIRASFYEGDCPTHRDFLGALMGAGITREAVGDICIGNGQCDFFATAEITPYLLQNFTSAGRVKLKTVQIALTHANIPQPQIAEISDTVSSLRLDSVVSSGFRISRSAAGEYIHAGKVAINGIACEKTDKLLPEGVNISLRGMGKIKLAQIKGQTKKGRISIIIHRYM